MVTSKLLLLQLAFKIYDRLKSSTLELTLHSYHTVLKGSKHLRGAGLQSLYAEMIASQNLTLKDKTFGYVFRAAASCGEALPASWLIQVGMLKLSRWLVNSSCTYCVPSVMRHR